MSGVTCSVSRLRQTTACDCVHMYRRLTLLTSPLPSVHQCCRRRQKRSQAFITISTHTHLNHEHTSVCARRGNKCCAFVCHESETLLAERREKKRRKLVKEGAQAAEVQKKMHVRGWFFLLLWPPHGGCKHAWSVYIPGNEKTVNNGRYVVMSIIARVGEQKKTWAGECAKG